MYGLAIPSLMDHFRTCVAGNIKLTQGQAKKYFAGIERLLDIQHQIASHHLGFLGTVFYPTTDLVAILLSSFHKNLVGSLGAYELTRIGLYGPARNLMRQVFEWLMVGKYCSLSGDQRLLGIWGDGEDIYFSNMVLKKILDPKIDPFKRFWKLMCGYSHATIYSQQVSLDAQESMEDIFLNVALLHALLECNYHLLNSHLITRKLTYCAKTYIENYDVPRLRTEAQGLFREARQLLGPESKKLLTFYKRKWTLKE